MLFACSGGVKAAFTEFGGRAPPQIKGNYVDWYVAVEPVEPELTQLTWIWTDKVEQ